jgi:predicted dinucleotide-binding enzyme
MKYSIIGTGNVGQALASLFAKSGIEVAIANTRGPESIALLAKELGAKVVAKSLDEALQADIIFFAVPFLNFKDVGALRSNWAGKIIVDVTNAAFLPQDVQDKELKGRLSSEVNADRVPGGKLVKAFNQLPMKALTAPLPADRGRRVIFIASDHADASAAVASLTEKLGFAPIELGKIAEGGRLIQARNALVFQNLIKYEG